MRLGRVRFIVCLVMLFMTAAVGPLRARDAQPDSFPDRLISLAPSTTEIVFALGLQDRLVGVSRYCDYPPAARDMHDVGGFFDPSYEEIVALRPDLVLLLESHARVSSELDKLGIAYLTTPHKTVQDIPRAVEMIGRVCGAAAAADSLAAGLRARVQEVGRRVAGRPRPRVLVCIGRDRDSGQMAGIHCAGNDGFYSELLELAGGVNALGGQTGGRDVDFPQLSAEGVIETDPDLIIDLVSSLPSGLTAAQVAAQWGRLPACRAVAGGRVHVIVGDHALRPGPRFALFLEELARLLHPAAFTGSGAP